MTFGEIAYMDRTYRTWPWRRCDALDEVDYRSAGNLPLTVPCLAISVVTNGRDTGQSQSVRVAPRAVSAAASSNPGDTISTWTTVEEVSYNPRGRLGRRTTIVSGIGRYFFRPNRGRRSGTGLALWEDNSPTIPLVIYGPKGATLFRDQSITGLTTSSSGNGNR